MALPITLRLLKEALLLLPQRDRRVRRSQVGGFLRQPFGVALGLGRCLGRGSEVVEQSCHGIGSRGWCLLEGAIQHLEKGESSLC